MIMTCENERHESRDLQIFWLLDMAFIIVNIVYSDERPRDVVSP